MKGRTPTKKEKEFMSLAADHGCIVCRLFHSTYSPAAIHHINGKTKQGCHFEILPLCFLHHQEGSDNDHYTSRHPYKSRFESRYGSESDLLKKLTELIE